MLEAFFKVCISKTSLLKLGGYEILGQEIISWDGMDIRRKYGAGGRLPNTRFSKDMTLLIYTITKM